MPCSVCGTWLTFSLVDCDFKLLISVRVSGFLPLVITGEVKGWQIVAEDET